MDWIEQKGGYLVFCRREGDKVEEARFGDIHPGDVVLRLRDVLFWLRYQIYYIELILNRMSDWEIFYL